jgi:hypothetical protein
VQIGPKDGTPLNMKQKVVNKTIWLIGTARNVILMAIAILIGYMLEETRYEPLILTGKYHVNTVYTYSHFTAQDILF